MVITFFEVVCTDLKKQTNKYMVFLQSMEIIVIKNKETRISAGVGDHPCFFTFYK